MKKRIIAVIAALAVLVGLASSSASYAWFVTSTMRAQSISVAIIGYDGEASVFSTDSTDFYGKKVIFPGQNLINLNGGDAKLTMTNNSSIPTQLRVKIEYTSYSSGEPVQVLYSANENEDFVAEFANPSQWLPFEGKDGAVYFYYVGENFDGKLTDLSSVASVSEEQKAIDVLSSAYYKETINTDFYSGKEVTVNVTFEAKQADYVDWNMIGEYAVENSAVK